MNIHDTILRETLAALPEPSRAWEYRKERSAPELMQNELLLLRDTAYELGGSGLSSVAYTCVTTDPKAFPGDRILLFGPDLPEISCDVPFARITLVGLAEDPKDETAAYRTVREIELEKYRISPKGYMIRASALDEREQVRVGKDAVRRKLSLEQIGDLMIQKHKRNPQVRQVSVLFITKKSDVFPELKRQAKRVQEITRALNKIMTLGDIDCKSCNLKAICDQVEDLRKLHFRQKQS